MSTTCRYVPARWVPIALALLLAGCATPKPILGLAGQGSATVALSEVALRDYLATTTAQLMARMQLMRAEAQREARNAGQHEFDAFLDGEAGMPQNDKTAQRIRKLGDERKRLREQANEEAGALEKKFALDASKLPQVPADKLAAAKKGFEVLAQELTPQEWLQLATAYAKEIKTGIDKLKNAAPEPAGGASAPAGTP